MKTAKGSKKSKKQEPETLAADFFAPGDNAAEATPSEESAEEVVASETAEDAGDSEPLKLTESPNAETVQPDPAQDEHARAEQRVLLKATIEALLFSAPEPLSIRDIGRTAECKMALAKEILGEIKASYAAENRAWELMEVAGGFRLMTRPQFHPAIQRLNAQRQQRKLTQAALETLALIAYSKAPVSRPEIEQIRGVDSAPVVKQLLERRLIQITGRGTSLGQPLLYGVSEDFLKHFGLKSAEELPQPGDFKSGSGGASAIEITNDAGAAS